LMHNIKVQTALLTAIKDRHVSGLESSTSPIKEVLEQSETCINSIMAEAKFTAPEEWQKGLVRAAVIPLMVDDIKHHGHVQGDWIQSVASMMKAFQPKNTQDKPLQSIGATQIQIAVARSSTAILIEAQNFSFLHNPHRFTEKVIKQVFSDAHHTALLTTNKGSEEFTALLSNLVKNYTDLMQSAIRLESVKCQQFLTSKIVAEHPNGLPLDGVFQGYNESIMLLKTLLNDLNTPITDIQKTTPVKTPSFMNR